jgi:hypothetical protein
VHICVCVITPQTSAETKRRLEKVSVTLQQFQNETVEYVCAHTRTFGVCLCDGV